MVSSRFSEPPSAVDIGQTAVSDIVRHNDPVPLAAAADEAHYGGKAVQLGEAIRAGLPVPAGIALPATLVAAFVAGDPAAAARIERARETLGDGPIAVRSSAVGEDSGGASFAGQHVTVLNAGHVLDAVAQVADSAEHESASAYRERLGRPSHTATGVVIQRLLPADVAGVLFTCDPVSGADHLVIEASWSLGEAVVSGLVAPDLYRLAYDGSLLSSRTGRKDRAVVAAAGGGTEVVTVDAVRASRPCLDSEALADLVALALRIRLVWPQASDIEWAFAGGHLSLLQRRPVTTLNSARLGQNS